jgi:small conductance mechanosensitive channel
MPTAPIANLDALTEKLVTRLQIGLQAFVVLLPNMVLAISVVVIGVLISRWALHVVERVLTRLTGNETISKLLGALSRVAAIAIAVLWALDLLHLDKAVTSVLAGVGVLGLALGFAFQDIAANFMSGFIMALYRPFNVGDLVEVADHKCKVQRIELRSTEVETLDGLSIVVPNKVIFQNSIINYTRTRTRRMDLVLGAGYHDDMEKVRSTVLAAVQNIPHRDSTREPELFFQEFADCAINFQVRVWLTESTQPAWLAARSEAMIAIKKAFDREDITIPFPIRSLDFGGTAGPGKRADAMPVRIVREPQKLAKS